MDKLFSILSAQTLVNLIMFLIICLAVLIIIMYNISSNINIYVKYVDDIIQKLDQLLERVDKYNNNFKKSCSILQAICVKLDVDISDVCDKSTDINDVFEKLMEVLHDQSKDD